MFSFTESLSRLSARRPWLTLAVCAVVVAIGAYFASGIGSSLTSDFGTTVELESDKADRLIAERMGEDEVSNELVVIRSDSLTVEDSEFRQYAVRIQASIEELMPAKVTGVVPYTDTAEEALVSESRKATIMLVSLAGSGDDLETNAHALRDAVREVREPDFETYVTGSESVGLAFTEIAESDLQTAEIFGLPIALIVLAIVFGALVAAGIPIIIALLSIVVAIGITALIGQQFTLSIFVVNVATMIGLAVGIDYTLFIIERFRDERRAGLEKSEAIAKAGATATRTVFFSGLTVIVALAGMLIIPDTIFRSIAAGAIIVVIVTVLASMTLLPAMLSILGDKVNAIRIPFVSRTKASEGGMWDRISRVVMAHPVISVVVTVALLLAAATPYLSITLGFAGVSTLPSNTDVYRGFAILEEEFSAGLIEETRIVVDAPDVSEPAVVAAIARLRDALSGDDAFGASNVAVAERGDLAVVSVPINADPSSDAAFDALARLRTAHIPDAFDGVQAEVFVGGETAGNDDYFGLIKQYTPIVFSFVLGLSFIVLLLVFRSIVVPIKALLMNLLSVGAAYGLLVLVFQEGIGAELLGFQQVERIEAWVPLFLFAVLFGLSMDYHVFLLSRIRERFDETHDNRESIAFGVRSTASIITGAALIMVAVFAGFAMGDLVMFQQMGFGLAVAVLIDATIVRSVLVPASMVLLGDANWYLPSWLRWLPDINVEGSTKSAAKPLQGTPVAGG